MAGDPDPLPRTNVARLAEPVTRDGRLDQYLRVSFEPADDGGPPWARSTGNQGSWVLSSIVAAGGLALVEAGEGEIAAGGEVAVLKLET
jgi:molybdopterin molybdotransferase